MGVKIIREGCRSTFKSGFLVYIEVKLFHEAFSSG
jgi:hypothetical protein